MSILLRDKYIERRVEIFKRWLCLRWTFARIAEHYGISKGRAAQIVADMQKNCARYDPTLSDITKRVRAEQFLAACDLVSLNTELHACRPSRCIEMLQSIASA